MKTSQLRRSLLAAGSVALMLLTSACGNDKDNASSANSSCTPKHKFSTRQKGKLSIAAPQYPPLFTYENGKMGGVDGAILQKFADDDCLSVDVQILPASGVIESVKSGRADVAAGGWYITEDRAKFVGQTDPVYNDGPVLVAKSGVSRIEDLKGKTIGTTQGYLWVADLQKFAGDKAKLYQSPDAVFADVVSGRVDAGLSATAESAYNMSKLKGSGLVATPMEPSPAIGASQRPPLTNFPYTKSNTDLGKALNAEIASLRQSGELVTILKNNGLSESAAKV